MSSVHEPDKDRLIAVLEGREPDRVPIFEHVIDDRFIEYALGLKGTGSLTMDPSDHIRLARHIGMDMVTVGYKWTIPGLSSWADLDAAPEKDYAPLLSRVDAYLSTLRGTGFGLNVYVHGPFDLTYMSMGYEHFFLTLYDDLDLIEAVMERFTRHSEAIIAELIHRGVDMIYLPDDIAFGQGLMIDPEVFARLWRPRMERLISPIIEAGIPRVYHSDGKSDAFLPWIIDLGFQGVTALEAQCNDIRAIKKRYGDAITLFGNFDVAGTLAFGTPEETATEVRELLEFMKPFGRYVAMSGNSITNGVKPENYQAMIETVHVHGKY